MIWGSLLAWDLFLAGLGAGTFIVAALANIFRPDTTRAFQLGGRLIAPIAVTIGLCILIIDAEAGLHNPTRFLYLLSNWGSIMTWGTAILSVFVVLAAVSALLALLKRRIPKPLDYVGIVLAAGTATYTGVLLGVVGAYPLWNTALLPLLFVVSASRAGMAAISAVAVFSAKKEAEQLTSLKKTRFALPLVEAVLIALLLFFASQGNPAGLASVVTLTSGSLALLFWGAYVVVGIALPFALKLGGLLASKRSGERDKKEVGALVLASCIGTLVGGFTLRYLILMAAVPIAVVF